MSDTPRTDTACLRTWEGPAQIVLADFSRQLERELATERALRLDAFKRGYEDAKMWLGAELAEAKAMQLSQAKEWEKLQKDNARLRKQLEAAFAQAICNCSESFECGMHKALAEGKDKS